jgi:DNA uptake protein ComE-like DNA-binding protein
MKNKIVSSFFLFTKEQRLGIVLLFSIIISLQIIYCFVDFNSFEVQSADKQKWLSFQTAIDSAKNNQKDYSPKIYPFNPNFITDFKGYKLGMTVGQIDKLLAYRKQNKYVNSASEFQQITGVSDSLLKVISPYFKFPDWVTNKKSYPKSTWVDYSKTTSIKKEKAIVIDINAATKDDLMKIYGIGDAISDRILKQKTMFGEFVSMDQMDDVWGLSSEVIEKLKQSFNIGSNPKPKKININNASIKELGQFPYFRYPISKNIVTFRSMNGDVKMEDLIKIKDFPVDKIQIIALYLEF